MFSKSSIAQILFPLSTFGQRLPRGRKAANEI